MEWDRLELTGVGDDLAAEDRDALVRHWKRRAASELRIGRGFAAMVPRLRAVGVDPIITSRFTEAASEERRHAELCLELAGSYAGGDPGAVTHAPFEMPDFRTGDERHELLFLVAGTCCINETLAVAYIRACLETATHPAAIGANRAHLRDEIGHGRMGWALLGSSWVDDELRWSLADRLPRLLSANVPLWLRVDPELGGEGRPALGHPTHAELSETVLECVRAVVVPGFAYVGVDVEAAKRRVEDLDLPR